MATAETFFDAIITAEGTRKKRNPYDEVLGYGRYAEPPKPLREMTVAEVERWSNKVLRPAAKTAAGLNSSATGAFQITSANLRDLMRRGILSPNQLYDETAQKTAAVQIYQEQGLRAWEGFKYHPVAKIRAKLAADEAVAAATTVAGMHMRTVPPPPLPRTNPLRAIPANLPTVKPMGADAAIRTPDITRAPIPTFSPRAALARAIMGPEAVAGADLAPTHVARNLAAQDAAVANRYRDNALRQTASIPGGRLSPEYVRPAAPAAPRRNLAMTAPQAGSSASIQPRMVTTTREGPGARIVPRQTYRPDLNSRSRLPAQAAQQMAETNAARAENVRRNAVQNLRGNLLAGSSPPKPPSPTYDDKKVAFLRNAQPTVTSNATRQAIRLATSGTTSSPAVRQIASGGQTGRGPGSVAPVRAAPAVAPSPPQRVVTPQYTAANVSEESYQGRYRPPLSSSVATMTATPALATGIGPDFVKAPNAAAQAAFAKAAAPPPPTVAAFQAKPLPAIIQPTVPALPAPPTFVPRRVVAQPQGMMGSSGGTKSTTNSIKDRSHGVFDREGGARSRSTTRVTGARKNTMSGRSSSLSRAGSDR